MKILECHSKGDKRFSALYAKITVKKDLISIEKFYQSSKRNVDGTIVEKGKNFDYLEIFGVKIPKLYTSQFYDLLWVQYFMENKDLYEYACSFDDYRDIFKGKSINNQENTIRRICKEGLEKVSNDCKDLKELISRKTLVPVINKDIFLCKEEIIAHQTNCKGVMGTGIALLIKNKYPEVFNAYKYYCSSEEPFGTCQIVKTKTDKYIANCFGQYAYGRSCRQTDYDKVRTAFTELKTFAKENNLNVAIPYKMGCQNAGGDWNIVEKIIAEVFTDYPVVVYKKDLLK